MFAEIGAVIAIIILIIYTCIRSIARIMSGGDITGGDEACTRKYKADEMALRKKPPKYSRILTSASPRLAYRKTYGLNFAAHQGQRKLLLAEVDFLNVHGKASKVVVYAGASPGTHIQMLLELFPHEFHLYDPRPITWQHPRMTSYTQMFTDADAQQWAGKDVLFLSDIRAGEDTDPNRDADIEAQMLAQQEWCRIMKPAMASLKFRLSWERPRLKYLSGTIHIQPWAPVRSSETRLWTNCKSSCTWDATRYDEQMFAHNVIVRPYIFDKSALTGKPALEYPGYDGCWDCYTERLIWEEYAASTHSGESPIHYMKRVAALLHRDLLEDNHGKYIADTVSAREDLYCGRK